MCEQTHVPSTIEHEDALLFSHLPSSRSEWHKPNPCHGDVAKREALGVTLQISLLDAGSIWSSALPQLVSSTHKQRRLHKCGSWEMFWLLEKVLFSTCFVDFVVSRKGLGSCNWLFQLFDALGWVCTREVGSSKKGASSLLQKIMQYSNANMLLLWVVFHAADFRTKIKHWCRIFLTRARWFPIC